LSDNGGGPEVLRDFADMFSMMERSERIQALIDMGDKFKPVPEEIASKPYPESHRAPHCESEAFVFWKPQPDGTLKFYFDVLNPQGISAKATAVILDKALSGAPVDEVAQVNPDVIYDIFGRELSMGKNMGLTGMVNMCKMAALRAKKEGA
jgi:cysteine desulfuration protein SufE